MSNYYNIYCDESDTNGQNIFWLGAIVCSPERADILTNKIDEIRNTHNFYSEFKWTKIKNHNFNIYKEFVDVFFDDKYVMFRVMSCKKNYYWNKWEDSTNRKMTKTYYCFIGWITMHCYKYNIYADQLFNDHDKSMKTITYLLNRKRKSEWDLKSNNIKNMKEMDSNKCDLIQLADVLMGAYKSSKCTNPTKIKMSNYIKDKLTQIQLIKEKRFRINEWEFRK